MQYLFSPSANSFFVDIIHGEQVPSDAAPVDEDVFVKCRKSLEQIGSELTCDSDGLPFVKDPQEPVLTPSELGEMVTNAIQSEIDAFASSWGYDSIISASTYLSSQVPVFKAESTALVNWRDSVWLWARSNPYPEASARISNAKTMVANALKSMPAKPERPQV